MVAINVTSLGYRGSIDDVNGARYFNAVGASRYGVRAGTHFQCIVTTGDRMMRVLPGVAWAHNIVDEMHTAATIQLDAITSGSRWDMIVLRRDPGTKTTTLEAIKGSSNKALPSRDATTEHLDQPLALCRVTAGQSTVQEIVDLRVFAANGGMTAVDDLALGYLVQPGATVEIKGVQWVCRLVPGGTSTQWVPVGGKTDFYRLDPITGYAPVGGCSVTQLPGGGRRVDVAIEMRRVTGTARSFPTGYWVEMGKPLPVEARGLPVGAASAAIQLYAPLFRADTRDGGLEPRMIWRIVPNSGEMMVRLDAAATTQSNWWWRDDESIPANFSYFLR